MSMAKSIVIRIAALVSILSIAYAVVVKNHAPVAGYTQMDIPLRKTTIQLQAFDRENDKLLWSIVSPPQRSLATLIDNKLIIEPQMWGPDQVIIGVSDSGGLSSTACIAFTAWLPYSVTEGPIKVSWDQFPADRSTHERQYTLLSGTSSWMPDWHITASHYADGGQTGPGPFAGYHAIKQPFGDVSLIISNNASERVVTVSSHADIASGTSIQAISKAFNDHRWHTGWTTPHIAAGSPLFLARYMPADGEVWILPPSSPEQGSSADN